MWGMRMGRRSCSLLLGRVYSSASGGVTWVRLSGGKSPSCLSAPWGAAVKRSQHSLDGVKRAQPNIILPAGGSNRTRPVGRQSSGHIASGRPIGYGILSPLSPSAFCTGGGSSSFRRQQLRFASTAASAGISSLLRTPAEQVLGAIPEPPPIPVPAEVLGEAVVETGLGDSHWFLSNWLMSGMDWLHLSTGLPWGGVIVLSTLLIRTLMSPVIVMSQRNAALLHNVSPEVQDAQQRLQRAAKTKDMFMLQEAQMDVSDIYKRNGIDMKTQIIVLLVSGVVFITYFFALRSMAAPPPVPGFQTEGFSLFGKDLTARGYYNDPYTWKLGACVGLSMLAVVILGTETGVAAKTMTPLMKGLFYCMPAVAGFITVKFPAAVGLYWLTSNSISLLFGLILRLGPIRRFCRIPEKKILHKSDLPLSSKSFVQSLKEKKKSYLAGGKDETAESMRQRAHRQFQAAQKTPAVGKTRPAATDVRSQVARGRIAELPTAKSILKKRGDLPRKP